MGHIIHKQKSLAIVYDSTLMETPGADYFSVDFWRSRQKVSGEAVGRGSAWFIELPFGMVVLRRYLRGGWMARINRRSYLYATVSRSRPFMEYDLLVKLYDLGLPVPRPVAALCEHRGIISRGALMTMQIPLVQTLADMLTGDENSARLAHGAWENIGRCVRRFHDAGVWHADLNARNVLLDEESKVFLIDFDRARFTPAKAVNGRGNLKRLKRSLDKLWPAENVSALPSAWLQLMAGYDD